MDENHNEIDKDFQYHYAYFIVSYEKNRKIKINISPEYKLFKSLEIIHKKYLYLKSCIFAITTYRFQISFPLNSLNEITIIVEDENKQKYNYIIKINKADIDYYEFNFKIDDDINIFPLSYEEQFVIYIDILRNKYNKDKNSKENEELISATQLLLEKEHNYSFLFVLLIILESIGTEYIDEFSFNPKKIKKIGKLSEEKLEQIKNKLNELTNNINNIYSDNLNNHQKILELFFSIVYYFNYHFQKEKLNEMINNPQIFEYLFNYFSNNKFIFQDLILPKEHLNKLFAKVKSINEIINLLYLLGSDCLQFINFINNNNDFILNIIIEEKDKLNKDIPLIEMDKYVKYKKDDNISMINKQIDLLILNERSANKMYVKISPLMIDKYIKYNEELNLNNQLILNHMIKSIKIIDHKFELETVNYIYFIESHEKEKNIKIEILDDTFSLQSIYNMGFNSNKKNFIVTIYRIKIVEEKILDKYKGYDNLQIQIFLEDEQKNRFQKIIDNIEKNKDIFLFNFLFDKIKKIFKDISPPIKCNLTYQQKFELFIDAFSNILRLENDEKIIIIRNLIKSVQEDLINFQKYDFSLYITIFLECLNLKNLIVENLKLFELKKIKRIELSKEYQLKIKEFLNNFINENGKIIEEYYIKEKSLFNEKISELALCFYHFHEKNKVIELLDNNNINTHLYHILLKNFFMFKKDINLPKKYIIQLLNLSSNFKELIISISCNKNLYVIFEIINENKEIFIQKFNKEESPIEISKIANPQKEDNFDELIKKILNIILYENNKKIYFLNFSPSFFEKYIQFFEDINISNCIIMNYITYLIRNINKEFQLNNYLNNTIYKKGLNFAKNKKFTNLELLEFIKRNTFYNENNYEKTNYRDLNILNGINIDNIDADFILIWREINWLIIFKSQENKFFEFICSLVKDLNKYNLLFELLIKDNQFENYKEDILLIIQKNILKSLKDYSIEELSKNINIFIDLICYMDKYKVNINNFIKDIENAINIDFILKIIHQIITNNTDRLTQNIIQIISNFFVNNIDKINLNYFIFLLKNNNKNEKYLSYLDNFDISIDDFITLEETDNYKLFKELIENNLMKDKRILKRNYSKEILNNSKFCLSKISEGNIKYNIIKDFIDNKQENILFDRIKLLYNFLLDNNYEKCENLIKEYFLESDRLINDLDLLYKDFSTFFPKDKKDLISLLEKDISNLKSENLNYIKNNKNKYEQYSEYKEAANIRKKYLQSQIFNLIFLNKKELYKENDFKIVKEAEKDFIIIKNIFNKENIKNDIYNNIKLFKKYKNNKDELKDEINKLIDIFNLENINIDKKLNEIFLLINKNDNIINAINGLLFLFDFIKFKKENLSFDLNNINQCIQNINDMKTIELSEIILKIYNIDNSNYKYLIILNEFKNKEILINNNIEKKENIPTELCILLNLITFIKNLYKITEIKDKFIIKIFLKFSMDFEANHEIISLFKENYSKIELKDNEINQIIKYIEFFKYINKDMEKENNKITNFSDSIKSFFEILKDKNEDLINCLILLLNKENILIISKTFKNFIEQFDVKKDKYFESIKDAIYLTENLDKFDFSEICLYILSFIEFNYIFKKNENIKLFNKFNKKPESIKNLLSESFNDYRILLSVIRDIDDNHINEFNMINIEKCFNFLNSLIVNNEIKNLFDFELIQIVKTEFIKNNNFILYFNQFFEYFYYIEKIIDKGFNKIDIYKFNIINICKNSLFILSNKEKNYFEGSFEMNENINENNEKQTKKIKKEITFEKMKKLRSFIEKKDNFNNNLNENNFYETFYKLLSEIEKIYNLLNNIYISGYPYEIIIEIKVNEYNISFSFASLSFNNREINGLDEILTILNEILNKFKSEQKNYYQNNKISRFIYGRQYHSIFNYLNKTNNINIFPILQFITNNEKIKITDISEWKEGEDEYKYIINNCNNFIEQTLKLNNISFNKIYKKSIIKSKNEFEKYRGLFIYPSINYDKEIFQIYKYLTGNSPIFQNILLCNEDISNEEITAFIYRAILCDFHSCFIIGGIEKLDNDKRNYLLQLCNEILIEIEGIMNSCLIFLNLNIDSEICNNLKLIKFKTFESKIKNEFGNQLMDDTSIMVISSDKPGFGKSTKIKKNILKNKKDYIYFPIGGILTRKNIFNRLKNLKINKNSSIHLDLYDTNNIDLMKEFLFLILITKSYKINEDIFYLFNENEIQIEIPNESFDFFSKFPILTLIPQNLEHKLTIYNLEKLIVPQQIDSDIQIVCNYLKLIKLNKIDDYILYFKNFSPNFIIQNILEKNENSIKIIDAEIIPNNECHQLIFENYKIGKNDFSYYQINIFIKLLAMQFKKFNQSYLLNSIKMINKKKDIKKARPYIINEFIKLSEYLTKIFFKNLLYEQSRLDNIFNEQNNKKEIEENINEFNKNYIISFSNFNQNLIIFHENIGEKLSIILNNSKKNEEYDILFKFLTAISQQLNDYEKFNQIDFLNEIKKILNSINPVKKTNNANSKQKSLEEIADNYIFTPDNFIKILFILIRISANIPIIIMGETGCGKTILIKKLFEFYHNKSSNKMKIFKFNDRIKVEEVSNFINQIINDAEQLEKIEEQKKNSFQTEGLFYNKKKLWIFLEEINTCPSMGIIYELICNKSFLGKKLPENIIFISACNPYRFKGKELKEKNNRKLAYKVNQFSNSLLNFVLNFGYMNKEDEKKYIESMIQKEIDKISELNNPELNVEKLKEIKKLSIDMVFEAQNFVRDNFNSSPVSLRDISRFIKLYKFFYEYLKLKKQNLLYIGKNILKESSIDYDKLTEFDFHTYAINLSIYICYYLRLSNKNLRKFLYEKLNKIFVYKDFLELPLIEEKFIINNIEIPKGIAINKELLENIFSLFSAINSKLPIIIINNSGFSKSLSAELIYKSMKGPWSNNPFFKLFPKIILYPYHDSLNNSSNELNKLFNKINNIYKDFNEEDKKKNLSIIFFDNINEITLIRELKDLNYILENNTNELNENIGFIGLINGNVETLNLNYYLCVSTPESDEEDISISSLKIAESYNINLNTENKKFFENLGKIYYKYKKYLKDNNILDFHGNQDFYYTIKGVINKIKMNKNIDLENDLPLIGLECFERNFVEIKFENNDNNKTFLEIIKNIYKEYYPNLNYNKKNELIKYVKENLNENNSRYLLLISKSSDSFYLLTNILQDNTFNFLIGSQFIEDLTSQEYKLKLLNKIKCYLEQGKILIINDFDSIYSILYDFFNQNFTQINENNFLNIQFGSTITSFFRVNNNFKCIVNIGINKINKNEISFFNRFEKHIISFESLLTPNLISKSIEIENILNDLIFNIKNNNYDIKKLLINCEKDDIQGMIYKFFKEGNNEDDDVIEKVFSKIALTFPMDIILPLLYNNNIKKKGTIFECYLKGEHSNLIKFLENMTEDKNIVYTLSNNLDNIINKINIINKTKNLKIEGKENIKIIKIKNIKSENEFEKNIEEFFIENKYKICLIQFKPKDTKLINYIKFFIENKEKEYNNNSKIFIFLIHMKRIFNSELNKEKYSKKLLKETISNCSNYYQIFIDNLYGNEKLNIETIIKIKNNEILDYYLDLNNEFEKYIKLSLDNINYNISNSIKSFNKENYINNLINFILKDKKINDLIKDYMNKLLLDKKDILGKLFQKNNIKEKNEENEILFSENDIDMINIFKKYLSNLYLEQLTKFFLKTEKISFFSSLIFNNENENAIYHEGKDNPYYYKEIIDKIIPVYFEAFLDEKSEFNIIEDIKSNITNILFGIKIPGIKSSIENICKLVNENVIKKYRINEYTLIGNKINDINETLDNYWKELRRYCYI